jgi:hypothetical protein
MRDSTEDGLKLGLALRDGAKDGLKLGPSSEMERKTGSNSD